jgi:hypothetical protein
MLTCRARLSAEQDQGSINRRREMSIPYNSLLADLLDVVKTTVHITPCMPCELSRALPALK